MKSTSQDGRINFLKSKSKDMLSPNEFFQQVYERYSIASESGQDGYTAELDIGGKLIRLHFASGILSSAILPAFKHLLISSSLPSHLDIYLWDSRYSGVAMISRPWEDDAFLPRSAVRDFSNKTIKTAYQPNRDVLSILNLKNNKAIYWVPDAENIPYFERGAPLLGILPQWFLENDFVFIHGGAVGVSDKGVLIVGHGGSDKSTTVLGCLQKKSFYYLADDYCLVESDIDMKVHSVYCFAKVDSSQVGSFPFLKSALNNPNRLHLKKALYFLFPLLKSRLIKTFSLKAILIPRILEREYTSINAASTTEGFRALTPSTIFQLPGFGHYALSILAKLVRSIPVYYLNLGKDSERVSDVIHNFLESLTWRDRFLGLREFRV